MNDILEITVQLFGVLRSHSKEDTLKISLNGPCSIKDIKNSLYELLKKEESKEIEEIISKSAIGNETEILRDDALISKSMQLAILPPVCGG